MSAYKSGTNVYEINILLLANRTLQTMQSNQSKLLMAGLVAAHSVTALEIKGSNLTQTSNSQAPISFAQIKDHEDPTIKAPSNSNTSSLDPVTKPDPRVLTPGDTFADSIGEKIDLLTDANVAGLDAK